MTLRIALYSHDSVGLGHIRRNLALAHALADGVAGQPVTGLLVAGRPEATHFATPPGWDWLILPSVVPAEGGYAPRDLDIGLSGVTALRGGAFHAAMRAFRPDLLIIDRHPLGVDRELERALRSLRSEQPGCRIVLGLRDVLDAPAAAAAEWQRNGGVSALRPLLDAIWVYGDPRIHDLSATGELPEGLRNLVSHTGYLAAGRLPGRRHRIADPFVLTTVGGGHDGTALALAAAAAPVPAGHRHLVVTGPQMSPADRRRVREAAGAETSVIRRVPDALVLMQRAAAVICMAGYNSISELMTTTAPALVAPRTQRRAEQRIRADALARSGVIDVLSPWALTPEAIGAWLAENTGRRVTRTGIALDGLSRIPAFAAELIGDDALVPAIGGDRVAV